MLELAVSNTPAPDAGERGNGNGPGSVRERDSGNSRGSVGERGSGNGPGSVGERSEVGLGGAGEHGSEIGPASARERGNGLGTVQRRPLPGDESEPGSGVGLANATERLQLLFGERATLQLDRSRADWTIARAWIPIA
jgi:hypothetical protein